MCACPLFFKKSSSDYFTKPRHVRFLSEKNRCFPIKIKNGFAVSKCLATLLLIDSGASSSNFKNSCLPSLNSGPRTFPPLFHIYINKYYCNTHTNFSSRLSDCTVKTIRYQLYRLSVCHIFVKMYTRVTEICIKSVLLSGLLL